MLCEIAPPTGAKLNVCLHSSLAAMSVFILVFDLALSEAFWEAYQGLFQHHYWLLPRAGSEEIRSSSFHHILKGIVHILTQGGTRWSAPAGSTHGVNLERWSLTESVCIYHDD